MTGRRAVFSVLGLTPYQEAYDLQLNILRRRTAGELPDTLLLLEHPPTITIGRFGEPGNVLASPAELATMGISLVRSDRGGDVTYHGPGQLVCYAIFDLGDRGRDIGRYIHDLEEVALRVLADFGISGQRDPGHPGVWVGGEGMAAIGLRVRRWVSLHGLALNVDPDLAPFGLINPCGLAGKRATSISRLLGRAVPVEAAIESCLGYFRDVFDIELCPQDMLAGSTP